MTTQLADKFIPSPTATALGRLSQEKQGLQSTKAKGRAINNHTVDKYDHDTNDTVHNEHPIDNLCARTSNLTINHVTSSTHDDAFPSSPSPNKRSNAAVYLLISHDDLCTAYFDLTGRFPQKSSRGNEYIMVGYHHDGNSILATALKDRTAQSIVKGWEYLHKTFELSGNAPDSYVLDNETSKDLIEAFVKNNVKYQLAPPHCHRTNKAERAIQTFKSHFLSGLATCDPSFPLREWDRLIEQATITLNLMRATRINPRVSAYTFMFGEYDYRSTPLVPPGIKLIAHVKPQTRGSWDLHGVQGYAVGPAMNHYRCIKCYLPETRSERICDTVKFLPNVIPIPKTNIDDYLRQSAQDIITILSAPPSTTALSLSAGDPVRNALLEIAQLLGRAEPLIQPTTNTSDDSSSPRVEKIEKGIYGTQVPRVTNKPGTTQPTALDIGVNALAPQSRSLKNSRFHNTTNHRYPLRSLHKHSINHSPLVSHQSLYHIFDANGKRLSIDSLLVGEDKPLWVRSLSNEWGRLANGNTFGTIGTNTITFLPYGDVPRDRSVTYATFVCDVKPLKKETHRVRITVGGDRLDCADDTGSPAANLLETKLLVNSTISSAKYGAKFFSVDITNYFLASPMKQK